MLGRVLWNLFVIAWFVGWLWLGIRCFRSADSLLDGVLALGCFVMVIFSVLAVFGSISPHGEEHFPHQRD
jgi:hypothetical protein